MSPDEDDDLFGTYPDEEEEEERAVRASTEVPEDTPPEEVATRLEVLASRNPNVAPLLGLAARTIRALLASLPRKPTKRRRKAPPPEPEPPKKRPKLRTTFEKQ